jgi:hypothetical protein
MGLVEFLGRLDPRRKLRLQFEKVRSLADALAAERDAYLQQRDQALGERNEILRQRDVALGERNELRRQLDTTIGERDEVRHQLDVATGERNELRRQLDIATGERNELRRQLDIATGEHNELRQQFDVLVGEHKEIFQQRDQALGERNELLRQRDETLGERNDMMRQRDHVIGQKNLLADRWARYAHRSDVIMRPSAGTRDRLLLFLHLARTGGVTLSSVFARNFATEEFLQIDMAETEPSAIGTWSHTAIERALARLETSEITKLRAIWGHYRHGIQELLPKPCAVVTLLRDPVDRVLSGFYYSHRSTNKDLQVLDDDLAQSPHHVGLDNSMTRVITVDHEIIVGKFRQRPNTVIEYTINFDEPPTTLKPSPLSRVSSS